MKPYKHPDPEEQEEEWVKAMRGGNHASRLKDQSSLNIYSGFDYGVGQEPREDPLGAAKGLWLTIRIVAGAVLGVVWIVNTIAAAKSGDWESWFLGTFFLGAAAAAFRWMERHPQGRLGGWCITVAGITMFLLLLTRGG